MFHFSPTGSQGSSISSCRGGVDQRERRHEVLNIITLAITKIWDLADRSYLLLTLSMLFFMVEHRRRTSSTLSSGVSSGRTTTPPTSHADSHALLTSTCPPSAACSTMTSSTHSSLAAPPCSTSPPSGLNTVLLVFPGQLRGLKQSPIREKEREIELKNYLHC